MIKNLKSEKVINMHIYDPLCFFFLQHAHRTSAHRKRLSLATVTRTVHDSGSGAVLTLVRVATNTQVERDHECTFVGWWLHHISSHSHSASYSCFKYTQIICSDHESAASYSVIHGSYNCATGKLQADCL